MKKFYISSIGYWFVLSAIAMVNAIVRETTYKPWLTPYIGNWAHQISSLTGILLLFGAIHRYLKHTKEPYTKKDLIVAGSLWIIMTITFESFMNMFIRKLTLDQVLQTYYFWKGEMWPFVLVSLVISPLVADQMLKRRQTADPEGN